MILLCNIFSLPCCKEKNSRSKKMAYCFSYFSKILFYTNFVFITVMVLLPSLGITTIAAATTARCSHFVFVMPMGRLFKTVYAQNTRRIHAAFSATVKRFVHFKNASTNGRCIFFAFYFAQDGLWVVAKNEFFQHIDDGIFGTLLIETTTPCKIQYKNTRTYKNRV